MHRLSKLVGWVAGLGLVAGGVLGGCGSPSPEAPDTAAGPSVAVARIQPTDGSVLVRYELTGTAVSVDGNYSEPADGTEKMVDLKSTALPWRTSFTLPPHQFFVAGLVAQGPNLEATVSCKIMKDSEVVAQETGPTVDCRAEIAEPTTGG